MHRQEALRIIEELLEREGQSAALAELRRICQVADDAERAGGGAAPGVQGVGVPKAAVTAPGHEGTLGQLTRALLENENTYRLVFSHELDPLSLFDPATGDFLEVNDAWLNLYGYSREEALRMKVTDVSAEPARTLAAIGNLAPQSTTRIAVRWHRAKDGTVFPVELTSGKLIFEGREVCYAVMRDITQRERAERALQRSEATSRALLEYIPDGVLVHRDNVIVYMSPAGLRMLGYSPDDDLVGSSALGLIHPDDREQAAARIASVAERGITAPLIEERVLRHDGSSFVAELASLRIVFDGEPAVLSIARDITARKGIEAQLVLNDRLASLGRLAASVGHELNNPLAYVLGNVTLMERELVRARDLSATTAERFSSYVTMIKEGAERMRDIVHDLKTLARGDSDASRMQVDIQTILDVCANMVEHELRSKARLVRDYRDKLFVWGTGPKLGQVFMNILMHAAQAIPVGSADQHEVRIVVRALDGDRGLVEISDTGVGIDPQDVERIFEPFFSTKTGAAVGGTGLGLSIAHRIVTSTGGSITAEPRVGGGTVFRVVLPTSDGAAN